MADEKDPFDQAALWASIRFRLSDEQWAAFTKECGSAEAERGIGLAFAATRPRERWTSNINKAVVVTYKVAGEHVAVPLRTEVENALRDYLARLEFRRRYPAVPRVRIEKELKALRRELREVRLKLCSPFGVTYTAAGPATTARAVMEALEDAIKSDLAKLGKESPGIVKGWERVHRELSRDPKEALIHRLRDISVWVFGGEPGTSDTGLTAQFIRAAARPVITLGNIRRTLEKLKATPSLYPQPRIEAARPEGTSLGRMTFSRPGPPRRSSEKDDVS
jgi:hypothetical protein